VFFNLQFFKEPELEQIQLPAQLSYTYAVIEVFLQGACWELDTEIWRNP